MRQVPGNRTTPGDGRVATHCPPCFDPLELPVRPWSRRLAADSGHAIRMLRPNPDALAGDPFQAVRHAFVRPHAHRA